MTHAIAHPTLLTCPDWCTRDHDAGETQVRTRYHELSRMALLDGVDLRADEREDVELDRAWHSMRVGGDWPRVVDVESQNGFLAIVGETGESMTAEQAREYAKLLNEAADRFDAILDAEPRGRTDG